MINRYLLTSTNTPIPDSVHKPHIVASIDDGFMRIRESCATGAVQSFILFEGKLILTSRLLASWVDSYDGLFTEQNQKRKQAGNKSNHLNKVPIETRRYASLSLV